MALVAFIRGVNVGGHRRFRPSLLVKGLADYDVLNIGATGLLVARSVRSRPAFRAALLRKLPFEAEIALCTGRELVELRAADPFGSQTPQAGVVRFVSVLIGESRRRFPILPRYLPPGDDWFVRIAGRHKRFVFGEYRRHMKTIGYLGKLDTILGRVTTRNWNTILAVIRVLEGANGS